MRIGETLDLTWDVFTKPADGLPDGDRRFRARLLSVLLLATILFSLIGLKYTHEGEISLEIQFDPVQERVGVAIRDTGMGVPEEEIPHLFERFYRSRRVGQSTIPGAGVGLAVAKKIVTMHGGDIVVKSRDGEGSTFTVWLPATSDHR